MSKKRVIITVTALVVLGLAIGGYVLKKAKGSNSGTSTGVTAGSIYTVTARDVATTTTVSGTIHPLKTVTLSAAVASAIDADTIVYSEDAGALDASTKKGTEIHATLVFGADAYGIIDVEGEGCLQTIVKPCGSGGAADPLDQRATVGAKVAAYTAKILNNLWIVRIEHGVSL